ncbi:MAG: hypothetical protein LBB93_02575, partial [Elusimicrobiota bacterium]|nr:hypothetical protein [Elusimicrobiota bacterium]
MIFIFLPVFFLCHIYIALRINMGLGIAAPYKYIILGLAFLIAVMMLVVQLTVRHGMPAFISSIASGAYILMGCFAITICVFILND